MSGWGAVLRIRVSVLFSEPKIPQSSTAVAATCAASVSVLFSEPKIPQCTPAVAASVAAVSFSALQRAENSSILYLGIGHPVQFRFQCSSASRKFLNFVDEPPVTHQPAAVSVLFSEPKIPQSPVVQAVRPARVKFQCSSASRKFLNRVGSARADKRHTFQCSSASRKFLNRPPVAAPFSYRDVSVLFSEPKIPQFSAFPGRSVPTSLRFSALQRAENSSIVHPSPHNTRVQFAFQCSSASRKFLNRECPDTSALERQVSVLFSEPKIPQSSGTRSSAQSAQRVSVLFSEPKIPQSQ